MAIQKKSLQFAVNQTINTTFLFTFNPQNSAVGTVVWWRLRSLWIQNVTNAGLSAMAVVLTMQSAEIFRDYLPSLSANDIAQAFIGFPNVFLNTAPPPGDPVLVQPLWLPDGLEHLPTDSLQLDTGTQLSGAGNILINLVIDYEDGQCCG